MALTYQESVEQTITAGEQIHQIVNGTATTEVTVEDGSKVPSIRKALLDNFYFKDPIAWQVGQTENVFNQLRQFTDGSWWYAPSATASNPVSMGSTPVGDSLWKIYDFDAIGKLEPRINEALRRSYAEAGYNLVAGSFEAGGTLVNSNDVLLQERTGKAFSGPAGTVAAGTNPASGGFVDKSGGLLRHELATSNGATKVGTSDGGSVQDFIDNYNGLTVNSVADLKTIPDPKVGAVVKTMEFTSGHGFEGGAIYSVISGRATANNANIIAHSTADVSFSARMSRYSNFVEIFGASRLASAATNTSAIQAALDNAPIGSNLLLSSTYPVTSQADHILLLSRNVNIVGSSSRAVNLRADAVGANTSILKVKFSNNAGMLDVRNWQMLNVGMFFNGGGMHCLWFETGGLPILTSKIDNLNLTRGAGVGACAIKVTAPNGSMMSHCEISNCTLTGSVEGNFGDANIFYKNTNSSSSGIAYVFDLEHGVRNNTIRDCTIVNRDGALKIINGGEVRFLNNQIEQYKQYGENQSIPSASVFIEGVSRPVTNTIIEGNNFGGGTNVDYSIYLQNSQHAVITKNNFIATDEEDIYCTALSKYNVYEFDNTVRNQIDNPRPDSLFKAKIKTISGYNIQMPMDFAGQNGWSSPTKAFYKAKDGRVVFTKQLSGGSVVAGTLVGTLPVGMWPTTTLFAYPIIDYNGAMGYVTIPATNGQIKIGSATTNGGIWIQPIQSTTDSTDF